MGLMKYRYMKVVATEYGLVLVPPYDKWGGKKFDDQPLT
jgi:hypothetical protein